MKQLWEQNADTSLQQEQSEVLRLLKVSLIGCHHDPADAVNLWWCYSASCPRIQLSTLLMVILEAGYKELALE